MKTINIAVAALILCAAAAPALAQERTIDGKAVSEGQMTAVDERCQELHAQMGAAGDTVEGSAEVEDNVAVDDKADLAASADAADIDVASITIEQCMEGGFIEK